jgi:GNAT superfamily N-acetyltransferase
MEGPRAPSAEELPRFLSFLTENLRKDIHWSLAEEYPLVLNPGNLANMRVIEENGKFLSGAAVKTSLVKSPAGLFKVAGIGSVVTDPAHRGRGLSSSVLESSLDIAKKAACDVAVLWSDLHDFYRKIGFELAGTEVSLKIGKPLACDGAGLKFNDSKQVAPEPILRLYGQHSCGAIRSLEDLRKSLAIPNSRLYTAWDGKNVLQAYAVEGKGADLGGYIHEWGGPVSKLLPLFNYVQARQNRTITVIAPRHAQNLVRQMTAAGAAQHEGVLGMFKIVGSDLLFAKLHRYARQLGIDNFVFENRNGLTHFGFGTNLFRTDSEADIIRLVFGPSGPRDLHAFDTETAAQLEKIFPIPFWIWGWDSV